MAIATTITHRMPIGNRKLVYGYSVLSGGSSGGDVATGLDNVHSFKANAKGSAAKGNSVNETIPLTGGDVTIVSETANLTFYWRAVGV